MAKESTGLFPALGKQSSIGQHQQVGEMVLTTFFQHKKG